MCGSASPVQARRRGPVSLNPSNIALFSKCRDVEIAGSTELEQRVEKAEPGLASESPSDLARATQSSRPDH